MTIDHCMLNYHFCAFLFFLFMFLECTMHGSRSTFEMEWEVLVLITGVCCQKRMSLFTYSVYFEVRLKEKL